MSKRDILDSTEHRYAFFKGPIYAVRPDDWIALRKEVARLRRKHYREANRAGPLAYQRHCECKDCEWVRAENRRKKQERKVRAATDVETPSE